MIRRRSQKPRGSWLMVPGVCLALATIASADSPIDAAEQALAAHLPEVAIVKLNALLASDTLTDDALRQRAALDLTQAMLDSGDVQGALDRLEYPGDMRERFLKAEALSMLGQWDQAIPLYAAVASDGPADLHEAAAIGQAEALHAGKRDVEARSILEELNAHQPSTLVKLRLAELYIENKELEPARKLFTEAKPANLTETRWHKYIEGRIYLAEDQEAPALEDFDGLLKEPSGLTPALNAAVTVGLAEARIALNGREVADDVIEAYISQHPDSPYLEEMFQRLDQIYAGEDTPSESELQRWAGETPARRAALALYYEGRSYGREHTEKDNDRARHAYTEFIRHYPGHAFAFDAWMQLGESYLEDGRTDDASDAFEGAQRASSDANERARAEIASGNTSFATADYPVAAEAFEDAASRATKPEIWLEATYDSALAWLHVRNYDRFLTAYKSLSERFPETDERRNLLLEEGLYQANTGDPRATATLQSFVRDFPDNRRIVEAQLGLAELVFADGDTGSASHLLKAAYESPQTPQTSEQSDYLAIFIADAKADRHEDDVLKLCQEFLDHWPHSLLRAQVRMKMGELYFRREDFANAQTQFETLAQESPSDALADKALILAGQSSVNSMTSGGVEHAIDLFEKVADGSGPLKLYARQEEALLKARTGAAKEAIIIYDDILRSSPETELRLAALCGKADCLVASAGESSKPTASPAETSADSPATPDADTPADSTPANDPAAPADSTQPGGSPAPAAVSATDPAIDATSPAQSPFAEAIALYEQVATDPDASATWRDQALYKKGRCLAKQGRNDEALTAYYDVLNAPAAGARQEPDFFWLEKAGYDAAAMLEAKSQWPGAINIFEKIAQAGGPRGAEAKKQADDLRLEHFVW